MAGYAVRRADPRAKVGAYTRHWRSLEAMTVDVLEERYGKK